MQARGSPAAEWYRLGARRSLPVPGTRLLLSSADRWRGVRVDLLDVTGPIEIPERSLPEHVVAAHIDGPAPTDVWYAGKWTSAECLSGDVCVMPANTPHAVRRQLPGRLATASLDAQWVEELGAEQGVERVEVRPTFSGDPLMWELLLALTNEVLTDNPSGPLYPESLASALAARLVRGHNVSLRPRGGLSSTTLRRVAEYIEAHLAAPLRLQDLAGIAGISAYQFARRFKRSTGLPPHQYVLQRRIERARDLLRADNMTVLAVALNCGFTSQSHFSFVFRNLTGVSPRRYRESAERTI